MRVLLAVHHFPPRYIAGTEIYTYRLARWLLDHGHEAEVVCIETLDPARPAGVDATLDACGGVPVWRLHLGLKGAPASWSYANPMAAGWVADHIRSERPDVLHLHSGYLIGAGLLEAAHRAGIPSVVTLHDYWFLCPRITLLRGDGSLCRSIPEDPAGCAWCLRLDQRRYRYPEQLSGGLAGRAWIALASGAARDEQAARRAYLRRALGLASLVIAPSHFLASVFSEWVPEDRVQILRLGLNLSLLSATRPPPDSGAIHLGYIGQIAPHKGVDLIVKAIRQLPAGGRPIDLAIYGNPAQSPAYTSHLQALISDDPRIRLAGHFANRKIADVMSGLDVTVVPSIWYENSPLAIMEAHAAGRPVITAALGGMAELVRHDVDGLHFLPGDAADLARQIQRLRAEPGLLARLRGGIGPVASVDDEMGVLSAAYAQVIARSVPLDQIEVA